MGRVRIKDIATKAGVSIGTVDRVLHNRGEVKTETKEKVLRIAKEMQYVPNLAARALKNPEAIKIGLLIPSGSNGNLFWDKHPKGIKLAVDSLQPTNVEVSNHLFDVNDAEAFKAKAKDILEEKPKGVILAPIFKNESFEFCYELDKLNIPYIFLDTYISETNCISFFGEDAYQAGRVAANLVDQFVSKEKDILIINIAKDLENIQHLNSRNQGFQSYFLDSGNNAGMKISVEIQSTDIAEVEETLDKLLDRNDNIGGVMVSSSKTYIVADYFKKRGNKPFLVGYEVFEKNIQHLVRNNINFLIGQRPIVQSQMALTKLVEFILSNQRPDKMNYQPIDIVSSENIKLFNE